MIVDMSLTKMASNPLVWYVKWIATIGVMAAVIFRSMGPEWYAYDMFFGTAGTIMWAWVAIIWRDTALILLNVVMSFLLISGIVQNIL